MSLQVGERERERKGWEGGVGTFTQVERRERGRDREGKRMPIHVRQSL